MYIIHIYNKKQGTQDGSLWNSCGEINNIRAGTIVFCVLVSIMQVWTKPV